MAIEPKRRYSGDKTEWQWTCSICEDSGPWTKDLSLVLDEGERHAKTDCKQRTPNI